MISKLLPKFVKEGLKQEVIWAGFEEPEEFFDKMGYIALILGAIIGVALKFTIFKKYPIYLLPLLVFSSFYSLYLVLLLLAPMMADMRAREVEAVLPDVLFLIASNLRSGMTIDRAIWYSAKDEFGIIGRELRKVSGEISMGVPFTHALKALGRRFKSDVLNRVIDIIIQGVISGGNLAPLLERVAIDIRAQKALEKEAAASVGMYTIFIIVAAMVIAPVLFAMSISLVQMMMSLGQQVELGEIAKMAQKMNIPISLGVRAEFTPEELRNFALITIILINAFAALIIGEIKFANALHGLKYMPIFVLISALLFHISHTFIWKFFSSMIGW